LLHFFEINILRLGFCLWGDLILAAIGDNPPVEVTFQFLHPGCQVSGIQRANLASI
jgi:hypothetical protein